MNTLRVAVIQMCSGQRRDENLARTKELLDSSLGHDPHLIALPENFTFLDREGNKLSVVEDPKNGPGIRLLRDFAALHGVTVVGGSMPLAAGDKVTNTCLVFGTDGSVVARYDKIHLFDIDLDTAHSFKESRYIAPGADIVTFDCSGHTMGLSICYDLRFPELYRELTRRGAKVLFVPAAFTHRTGTDHWEALLRARAVENFCYVVAPAQVGRHNDQRESYGRAMVVDPWGQILAQAPDYDCVISAELDFAYLADIRRRMPCLEHARLLPNA